MSNLAYSKPEGEEFNEALELARIRREKWRFARVIYRNKTALTGLIIMLFMTFIAVFAPLLTSKDPLALNVPNRLKPPSIDAPMGTDEFGRDTWARVAYGARLSLQVGLTTVFLSAVAGSLIGLAAGFYRYLDNPVMRVMDGLMALPGILLAIALMAALGPSVANVIFALTVVYTPRFARVVRASVLVVREQVYVEAATALGARDWKIILRHILPNCLSSAIVQATFIFATAVLSEASLSFLGVGAPPQIPSWGNILSEGRLFITDAPWLTVFPGVAIVLIVLGLNLFGDGLRDALDPRMRDL